MQPAHKAIAAVMAGGLAGGMISLMSAVGIVGTTVTAEAADRCHRAQNASASMINPVNVKTSMNDITSDPKEQEEARKNAGIILSVVRKHGFPARAEIVAIATAIQESKLQNIRYGDRDSLGLFQQRPSADWGTPEQIMDPVLATEAFLGVSSHSKNEGLKQIAGWESMPITVAAQKVQKSGFPDAYAQWEGIARAIATGSLSSAPAAPTTGTPQAPPPQVAVYIPECTGVLNVGAAGLGGATISADKIIQIASSYLGVPYAWGGGDLNGPTEGFAQGAGIIGLDCSGFTRLVWFKAGGVTLPRTAGDQAAASPQVPLSGIQPGDLLYFGGGSEHIVMYAGGGSIIHAPHTGDYVKIVPNFVSNGQIVNPYWSGKFSSAHRPRA